ncbi:hypothetical protein [Haloflavibacter putidus]|uniref:Secreted protein n=1 Tax=Haloflavibacter putidus TaxID=2576776 RepID=A0A507ZRK3_9FLAO|nr:hypothetical protein [Haloflavibacter putidus]TQD40250.1 hypothetical protein FKR84_03365 [Haloflavibacter putidus]
MKKIVFLFGIFAGFLPVISYAQLDNSNTTTSGSMFGRSTNMNGFSTSTPSLSKTNKGIYSTRNTSRSLESNNETLDITKNEGFIEPNQKFDPKYLKKQESKRNIEQFKRNQDLGEFRTTGANVKLLCRDHQAVDGDLVRIIVNGKVALDQVFLEGSFKSVFIKLEKGFNKIEIEALNQGSSGPNTAAFKVLDDQGTVISSNQWNLATGFKASMIVIKEE